MLKAIWKWEKSDTFVKKSLDFLVLSRKRSKVQTLCHELKRNLNVSKITVRWVLSEGKKEINDILMMAYFWHPFERQISICKTLIAEAEEMSRSLKG